MTIRTSALSRGLACAVLSALVCATFAAAQNGPRLETKLDVHEVADGVWAILQPEAQRFNDSNSIVIDLGQELLLVDAQADGSHVQEIITWLRDALGKPVRYLVNTHWHGDHVQGNALYRQAYGNGLLIIGHESLRDDVPGRAAPAHVDQVKRYQEAITLATARFMQGVDREGNALDAAGAAKLEQDIIDTKKHLEGLRHASFLAPDVTFRERLDLHRGGRTVELHHFRAHTRGDTVLYLPKEKILVTGDLLDALPYGGHGYPGAWIETLETLESFDFETMIPGHGRVFQGKEQLREILALVRSIVAQTKEAVAAGKSLEETQEAVDLSRFRESLAGDDAVAQRNFDHFMPETIARAWKEAKGELED